MGQTKISSNFGEIVAVDDMVKPCVQNDRILPTATAAAVVVHRKKIILPLNEKNCNSILAKRETRVYIPPTSGVTQLPFDKK